jgi:hypothetical protein
MAAGEAPVSTGHTESQGLGITEAEVLAPGPWCAPAAPLLTGNGAHMGRGQLPERETASVVAIQEVAQRIAEAIATAEFDRARALMEDAIRRRSNGPFGVTTA